MELELVLQLLDQYGIPLVLIAVLTAGFSFVGKRLLAEMAARIQRSEELVDTFKPSIDALTGAVKEQTAAIRALDESLERSSDLMNALLMNNRRAEK